MSASPTEVVGVAQIPIAVIDKTAENPNRRYLIVFIVINQSAPLIFAIDSYFR
jgi:hypothetical protein